jgi:hypothetical protein
MWTKTRLNDGTEIGHGLGWEVTSYRRHKYVGHGGYTDGFQCRLSHYVVDRNTIVVLPNFDSAGVVSDGTLASEIANSLLFTNGKGI